MARQLEDTLDDLDTRPHKKQRKQRARLSCTECRRLKMKCDRQEPCSNCVRRSRASICRIDQVEQSSLSEVDHDGTTTLHDITLPAVNDDTTAELLQPDLRMEQSQPLLSQIVSSTPLVESDMALSNGTLTLDAKGRYRYLGPTAGSEWLKDSETRELDSAPGTRAPSPQRNHSLLDRFTVAFPFGGVSATGKIGMQDMLMQLPPREEAQILVEAYYKYCAWHHDVAPRSDFSTLFNEVYTAKESMSHVDPQDLALVYIIIAQGTMFNIEMPDQDPSGEDWLRLAELALVKGEFLSNNTLSGIQCLHLMAHMHLQLDKGRQGDKAWPLWGLVMRLVQAMGLHRDGARWNLPPHVVQQRRKVFWELQAAETFQAHCFSRPSALNPEHYDTAFPDDPSPADEKSYSTLRFELSQLSAEILNLTVKVRKPAYSEVAALNARLSEFERSIPYKLRCRAALLAMPSRYSDLTTAIEASPEPSRRSMSNAFQQTNLALNVTETFINLNRPYFAKAVYDDKGIRVDSEYGPSFLTVIERCAIIIAITKDIHERFPAVSTRQWNLWHHVFNTALCLGTLVLRDSSSSVASFAVAQIETATELFTSLLQHGAKSPRYQRNLQWLLKLRSRLAAKLQALPAEPADDSDGENPENMELLGWRTRLIEQVDQDHRRGRPIRTARSFTDASGPPTDPLPHAASFMTPESTDELLHAFWDPMLLQDIFPDPTNHNVSLQECKSL